MNDLFSTKILQNVIEQYGLNATSFTITTFGTGLINKTWLVSENEEQYILQKINKEVFNTPKHIADNIEAIALHLQQHHPNYFFVAPLKTKDNSTLVKQLPDEYFRMFPFVKNSHSINVAQNAHEAFEAAKQFGKLTALLQNFNINNLSITIPNFHNLSLRYQQFIASTKTNNKKRLEKAKPLLTILYQHKYIVDEYENLVAKSVLKKRVTHHDTKISNVLFNDANETICVIDLDTLMPGYFISDVGDMLRTYISPVDEEEADINKIEVREDFYKAIVSGYYSQMKNNLSELEVKYFFYAGLFMIYMQALRFLTDYLNNDVYYGEKYSEQNFVRAQNQTVLLQKLLKKKQVLESFLEDYST